MSASAPIPLPTEALLRLRRPFLYPDGIIVPAGTYCLVRPSQVAYGMALVSPQDERARHCHLCLADIPFYFETEIHS